MAKKNRNQVYVKDTRPNAAPTFDSYANFLAQVGIGTGNVAQAATYVPTLTSRNRQLIESMYRSSWLVGQAVDVVAEDMTRAGITIMSEADPSVADAIHSEFNNLAIWERITQTVKWGRLYGGALAYIMIDGQNPATPLRADTVNKGQFKGLLVLDRWAVQPSVNQIINDQGPDIGLPMFYSVISDAVGVPKMKIHHSRVLRVEGVELPYYIRVQENFWGMSVIERLFDRLTAFDSTTLGAAQLVFQARLRILKIAKLRQILSNSELAKGLATHIDAIRAWQRNEGLTVIDGEDQFDIQTYAFSGLSDLLVQFGQQISGALQIPLVRLFGQSPAGLNSTGESDMRTYYDGIAQQQKHTLRRMLTTLIDVVKRSTSGGPMPEDWSFEFRPLWQMTDQEKQTVASGVTNTISAAVEGGLVGKEIALRELREQSRRTGIWTNITPDDIRKAKEEDEAPPMPEMPMPGGPDVEQNQQPKQPPSGAEGEALEGQHPVGDRASILEVSGIEVVIENDKGELRSGNGWSVRMPAPYGYIRATTSAEGIGEQMDAFVGPNRSSNRVWIIYQKNPDTGAFDEHKVMLGYDDQESAIDDYLAAHDDGKDRIMKVERMSINGLRSWLDRHWAIPGVAAPFTNGGLRTVQ